MKKVAPLFLFVLCMHMRINAQWHQLLPASSRILNALSFPSDDTGYEIAGKIYRTFDGGISIDSVTIPGFTQYTSISFLSMLPYQYGIVTGLASGGKVFRTVDGGNNWFNITPPNLQGTPMYAEFHSFTKATLLSSAPVVYRTFDSGTNWDTISFGYDYFNSVSYPDSSTGYIAGFDGTFNYRGVVMKTIDGGHNWMPATIFTQNNTDIHQVQFVSADTGFAIFNDFGNTSRIIRTVDGAASWDTVIFNYGTVIGIAFLNRNIGFAVNDTGNIYRTLNAGATWTIDYRPNGICNDACVTPHFAYAVGSNGLFAKRDWLSSVNEEYTPASFSVYPDPASCEISICGNGMSAKNHFDIIDASGKVIMTAENPKAVNISGLAPGIYFIRDSTGVMARFVKE